MRVSPFFVGISTTIVAEAKEQSYMDTMEVDYEVKSDTNNGLEEVTVNEKDLLGYTIITDSGSDISVLAAQSVSWTVGTESIRLSGTFIVQEGDTVRVFMAIEPDNLNVCKGLKQPNGT